MTNEASIQLTMHCDRTNEKYTLNLPLSTAAMHYTTQTRKAHNAEKIKNLFEVIAGDLPDLVVCYKGNLVVLNNLAPRSEKGLQRYLHMLTLSSLFPLPVRKTRKSKVKQGKRDSTPPFITEGIINGEVRS